MDICSKDVYTKRSIILQVAHSKPLYCGKKRIDSGGLVESELEQGFNKLCWSRW